MEGTNPRLREVRSESDRRLRLRLAAAAESRPTSLKEREKRDSVFINKCYQYIYICYSSMKIDSIK